MGGGRTLVLPPPFFRFALFASLLRYFVGFAVCTDRAVRPVLP